MIYAYTCTKSTEKDALDGAKRMLNEGLMIHLNPIERDSVTLEITKTVLPSQECMVRIEANGATAKYAYVSER